LTVPKVSICIPAYQQHELLRKVLQSIKIQTFDDYEIIISDDSTDDAIENVVSDFNNYMNIQYVRNYERMGTPANWNRAIGMANGELIKILHHDDWLLTPQSLNQFVEVMDTNPQAVIGFSAAAAYNREHCLKFVHTPSENWIHKLKRDSNILFLGNKIGPPSSIIYRNSKDIRFDENLRWLVDVEFYIKLLKSGKSFVYLQEPLVGVTVESAHQVTRDCENNKQVELFEYLYLFSKLAHKEKQFYAYLKFFSQMFKRFSIRSSKELALFAQNVDIPWYIRILANVSG
jgi:glycosyltransferase involved in cell wall biosynthesis